MSHTHSTDLPTSLDRIDTYHPAIRDTITDGRFGVRASISVAAAVSNAIGFAFANALIPKAEPKKADVVDPRYAKMMGLDGVTKKETDITTLADGYIAAQLLVVHFANKPDASDFGKRNEWAKTYCRTGAQLVENVLDWRARSGVRKAEAELAKFQLAGVKVDMTARAEAIKKEAAITLATVADEADATLLRQYESMADKTNDELWDCVVLAFTEMDQPLTRAVYRSLQAIAESQAKRLMLGQYATMDSGIASLMNAIQPAPVKTDDEPAPQGA